MAVASRVTVVTGGSRGIGSGMSLFLARKGASLVIAYRSNKTPAQNALHQMQA